MLGLSSRYFLTAFEYTLKKALDRIDSFLEHRNQGARGAMAPHFLANCAEVSL